MVSLLILVACSDTSDQAAKDKAPIVKKVNKDHVLKGYQDNIQRAKDVEKEVLKAAEKKKKIIDDATN